ncbi:hypothetical protein OPV22_024323 [Ensete ventricosum]|uniref:Uncharacterized protein n=1 Tax=Ensete ventricosum TaxID=4639 RepID=A0AAV8QP88_ENSVE|nr:hypothetical protein OPV22_024323 [Ensete ventricosum]
MEASKLLIASIAISLVFVGVWADAGAEEEAVIVEPDVSDSVLKLELEQLRSKISALESSILDKTRELKSKDESIAHLEKIIEEKAASILSLQSEIESVQRQGTVDAEELVKRANVESGELGKQVEKLKNEIELQNRRRHALDARASEAEKKVQELSLKLENLQKTNDEQRHRIHKTERALKVAEEELMRAQLEATAKSMELSQAHGAWLPPWLAAHIIHYQEFAATYWKEHAKPALDVILEKATEKLAQAQKWVEPQLETAKTKWVPAIKERWVIFVNNAEPYVQIVYTKTVEVYHTSKSTIATYVIEVLELADPYFQLTKKFSKPYIDQVATITKPHVEQMQVYLKPYTKWVILAYGKFLKSATTYHRQVQAGIRERLKHYELTKVLATKELVWFMASALLALPIFLVYRLLLNTFCSKKTIKSTRNGHSNHTRRNPKQRHADK